MAGVSGCMKYSMFIFNFLFWVCGLVILGVSVWIRVSKDAQQELDIDASLFAGVDLLIAVGSIITVLGFLGCCGAIKESRCMLLLFFIGLLLILILQITGGVLGAVYRSQIETSLNKTLLEKVNELQSSTGEAKVFQEKFQKFEKMNHCCGLLNGPADWGNNFQVLGGNKICECELEDRESDLCIYFKGKYIFKKFAGVSSMPGEDVVIITTDPCGDVIIEFLEDHLLIITGIAFGLAVIEILGLGFSMSLYCQIQRK